MGDMKRIAGWVRDPKDSIFGKAKKSDRVELRTISCELESCPLRDKGQCAAVRLFGNCPHGRYRVESGPTLRSKNAFTWLKSKKEETAALGWLESPPDKMEFIGDFVFLPYAHVTMCKAVPFVAHSAFIVSGVDFLPREYWTLKTVLTLIDFRPQAMMGGEITDYQAKVVPLFKEHLRECDPAMWAEVVKARPQYDVAPNYVGRKALVRTLKPGITIPARDGRYPVEWSWDGAVLHTTSKHAYNDTWGGLKGGGYDIAVTPDDKTIVVVADNSWVIAGTMFAD